MSRDGIKFLIENALQQIPNISVQVNDLNPGNLDLIDEIITSRPDLTDADKQVIVEAFANVDIESYYSADYSHDEELMETAALAGVDPANLQLWRDISATHDNISTDVFMACTKTLQRVDLRDYHDPEHPAPDREQTLGTIGKMLTAIPEDVLETARALSEKLNADKGSDPEQVVGTRVTPDGDITRALVTETSVYPYSFMDMFIDKNSLVDLAANQAQKLGIPVTVMPLDDNEYVLVNDAAEEITLRFQYSPDTNEIVIINDPDQVNLTGPSFGEDGNDGTTVINLSDGPDVTNPIEIEGHTAIIPAREQLPFSDLANRIEQVITSHYEDGDLTIATQAQVDAYNTLLEKTQDIQAGEDPRGLDEALSAYRETIDPDRIINFSNVESFASSFGEAMHTLDEEIHRFLERNEYNVDSLKVEPDAEIELAPLPEDIDLAGLQKLGITP